MILNKIRIFVAHRSKIVCNICHRRIKTNEKYISNCTLDFAYCSKCAQQEIIKTRLDLTELEIELGHEDERIPKKTKYELMQ